VPEKTPAITKQTCGARVDNLFMVFAGDSDNDGDVEDVLGFFIVPFKIAPRESAMAPAV
jgi:hypothetical protein